MAVYDRRIIRVLDTQMFKTPSLAYAVGTLLVVASWLHGQTGEYEITRTFISPNGAVTAEVAAEPPVSSQQAPPIYSLGTITNDSFVPFEELPPPLFRREYHGTSWFNDIQPRWIDDRFLIFEDVFGLAIADVPNRRMLVNHVFVGYNSAVFAGYEKSPVADKWAAIRFRPMSRDQELLDDNFEDTLLLIDPYDVANRIDQATEENFVGQMKAVKPGGIVLSKPQWATDGSSVAVLTWKRGKVEAVRYDTGLKETGRATVNLKVDPETALSPALNSELKKIAESILSDSDIRVNRADPAR